MARNPTPTKPITVDPDTVHGAAAGEDTSFHDTDFPNNPPDGFDADEIEDRSGMSDDGVLSWQERFLRLERVAIQHFGRDFFTVPAAVYNPELEKEAARARYVRDMEAIDAAARNAPVSDNPDNRPRAGRSASPAPLQPATPPLPPNVRQ